MSNSARNGHKNSVVDHMAFFGGTGGSASILYFINATTMQNLKY